MGNINAVVSHKTDTFLAAACQPNNRSGCEDFFAKFRLGLLLFAVKAPRVDWLNAIVVIVVVS